MANFKLKVLGMVASKKIIRTFYLEEEN